MKFKSKFGFGEIVENNIYKGEELISSELYEVIYVVFDGGHCSFGCRHSSSGFIAQFKESELSGDNDYSQYQGKYINEEKKYRHSGGLESNEV